MRDLRYVLYFNSEPERPYMSSHQELASVTKGMEVRSYRQRPSWQRGEDGTGQLIARPSHLPLTSQARAISTANRCAFSPPAAAEMTNVSGTCNVAASCADRRTVVVAPATVAAPSTCTRYTCRCGCTVNSMDAPGDSSAA